MSSIVAMLEGEDSTTEEGLEKIAEKIKSRQRDVQSQLEQVLSRQCNIETKMVAIGRSLGSLSFVKNDSEKLIDVINHTAELANKVSAKVRRLDEARSRVSECQQRMHDLIDLQLCSQGVMAAIKEEDFEKGAGHINRFLSMDQNLLQKTADDVSGSITVAVTTLEQATLQMREIIMQKFVDAVAKDDLASVERFFKIFPIVGMKAEGIEKFSNYICSKLQHKSQKELRSSMDVAKAEKRSAVAYADTLTVIFENLARVIEINQPIIENCYGQGMLVNMYFILQKECDQEVERLLEEFYRSRQITRRVNQINDYIKNKGSGSSAQSNVGHFRKGSGGSVDKLNPKEIDNLIGEITIMHSRAELYIKFMKRRVMSDLENSTISEELKQTNLKLFEQTLNKSYLNRQMQELLGIYLLFERYFMEESVLKAISMDVFETGQQCTSMVDDVFFIVRKSIRRSIATQSLDGVCAVLNNSAACLETDFITAMKTHLKNNYPSGYIDLAYNAFQTSLQQGKIQTNDTEQAKANFIAQLNNADISTEYIETLWSTMAEEIRGAFPAINTRESEKLDSCLSGLRTVRDTLKAIVDFGLQQLRSSAIKPRLNTWIDQFTSYNHQLNEEELSTYEAGETFVQSLIIQLSGLLNTFKMVLSPRNYDTLVGILATDVTARLERAIKKSSFNRLGGLILDQEVRVLGSYLTGATSWSVRDKLVRLTQIATLLNMEKISELADYWNPSDQDEAPAWRLTPNEVRTVLALRIDFKMDDIKRVKL